MDLKPITDTANNLIKALKGHREGIVAIGFLVVGGGLLMIGAGVWFAFGLPVTLYVLYHVRMLSDARHKERVAARNLERLALSKLPPVIDKAKTAVKRRTKNAPR